MAALTTCHQEVSFPGCTATAGNTSDMITSLVNGS